MAGRGPAPKPSHLRQRTNHKAGARVLEAPDRPVVPKLPNPDGRTWHPMTLALWREWWESEMASEWLKTDVSGLGMLAVLYDEFFREPNVEVMKEIRLQRACFGLTPVDRSRLQWEIGKGEEAERRRSRPTPIRKATTGDPRRLLMAIK